MNEFELFTMIYFALDAYYEQDIEDSSINTVLNDMNPFVWSDESSADPAMYRAFLHYLNGREIQLENSLSIAMDYLKTIKYADVTAALQDMGEDTWIEYCKKYLSESHKGGAARNL